MSLNISNWKEYKLGNLFSQMYKAEAHVKSELETEDVLNNGTIRFISRTEANNGCDCYIRSANLTGIERKNAITIGDTTATCFYQSEDFVCGDHIVVCRAEWLNLYTGLFVLTILKREKYKYSYGRAFKMDLIENTIIKLPAANDGTPDWAFIESSIKSLNYNPVTTKNRESSLSLNVTDWKEYLISDIFNIYNGKCITQEEIEENPGNFIAVQSGEENNGVLGKINKQYCIDKDYTYTSEKCLTVARSGSAGFVSYQNFGCVVGDSAKILILKEQRYRNQYIYLFLKTILMANKYKYTYGRKVTTEKYLSEVIKLPTKNDMPDWGYMENYIKLLPYGDKIANNPKH